MTDAFPTGSEILSLSGRPAFASGSIQHVYAYPGRPDLLIKIVKQNFAAERWTGWRGWLKRRRRIGVMTGWLRMVTEHLALRNTGRMAGGHIQDVVGFVETDLGVGLVTRAVRDRNGDYAPTLKTLIEQRRFDAAAREKFDEFARWLVDAPIVVGDLHIGNLVLGDDAVHGERFVLIDGMGDKAVIPINSLFPPVNRWKKKSRLKRMERTIAKRTARAAEAADLAA